MERGDLESLGGGRRLQCQHGIWHFFPCQSLEDISNSVFFLLSLSLFGFLCSPSFSFLCSLLAITGYVPTQRKARPVEHVGV